METINLILNILILIIVLVICIQTKIKRRIKFKEPNVINTIANKKLEDDLVIEKDRDLVLIDEYINFIKNILDKYNNSRNKRIAYRTRQEINFETFKIVPIVNKYITLAYYYNLDDKDWYQLTDTELMKMLEAAYNDYTHDNLDSLNSIISVALRLRDDKR